MIKKVSVLIIVLQALIGLQAQVTLSDGSRTNDFSLVGGEKPKIYIDDNDFEVVKNAANLFSEDIRRVTDTKIEVKSVNSSLSGYSIVAGTLGHNKLIDQWVSENKINTSKLTGKWESYLIQVIDNPAKGVKKALVIMGSDRRGTAYGVFKISETIGVSPWYWFADAPVTKHKKLAINVERIQSHEPSVKYRGVFLNDEDWGLLRWAKKTYEPDRGNIGPKTYARICELLLRLKANYLCPAMHEASTAFNQIPENKLVAESYAIAMGSTHPEPLLFNNASEWDTKTMGEWNYETNKAGINKQLRKRVEENSPYENVYTLALRGLHDRAMAGSNDMSERVKNLAAALKDQQQILLDVIKKPSSDIPQIFVPYKEVLDVYSHGLEVPDDVTIIWADDNYGYMKRLSGPREQKRAGRSGVYYHVSYLGKPHDYLWLGSTPPALMYEELRKAYDTTADRVWLLNCGDLKPNEFLVDLFINMAYDINSFSYDNIHTYQAKWLSNLFGQKYYDKFLDVTNSYYNLAFARKPELMGWGYQWSTQKHGKERNTDTDFSFSNYKEADSRISEYDRIGKIVSGIMAEMNTNQKPSLYQLLYYPVKGSELLNKMILNGQKNRLYALQGRASANTLKTEVKADYDSLQAITDGYNSLLNGKWNQMMTTKQGFAAAYFEMPKLDSVELANTARLGIMPEGRDVFKSSESFYSLPSFNTYTKQSYYFDIFNSGSQKLNWKVSPSNDWIKVNQTSGNTDLEDRIWVSIDWSKAPKGDRVTGNIEVTAGNEKENILISVFNPVSPSLAEVKGIYMEDNGYISIDAAGYHRKIENDDIKIRHIHNLGFEHESVQLGDPVAPMQKTSGNNVPSLEYDFYTFQHGSVDVYTYTLPTFPLTPESGYAGHESTNIETKYGVCIDDGPVMTPTTSSFEYAQAWYENVLRNCSIKKTTLHLNKPGTHTVKILCGDAGVVVQKIVLDFGGMKRSYMGPRPTLVSGY